MNVLNAKPIITLKVNYVTFPKALGMNLAKKVPPFSNAFPHVGIELRNMGSVNIF